MKTKNIKRDSIAFDEVAIIEKLKNTQQIKSETSRLADDLSFLPPDKYDNLLNKLTQEYEGPALGNLLIVSAINQVKLNPEYLAIAIKMVDNLINAAFAYKYQDKNGLQALINFIEHLNFGWVDNEIYALQMAIELSLKFNSCKAEIKKIINIVAYRNKDMGLTDYVLDFHKLLENGRYGSQNQRWITALDPLNELPEKPEEPHKKQFLTDQRPWEFGKLDPKDLNEDEFEKYIELAAHLRLFDKAYDLLLEFRKRSNDTEIVNEMTRLLFSYSIAVKNLVSAQKIEGLLPDNLRNPQYDLIKELVEKSEAIEILDRLCRMEIENQEVYEYNAISFLELLKDLTSIYYPALNIILRRASIASCFVKNDELKMEFENIKFNRIQLGIWPDTDSINTVYESVRQIEDMENQGRKLAKENSQLRAEIKCLNLKMAQLVTYLQQKQIEIKRLNKQIENWKK